MQASLNPTDEQTSDCESKRIGRVLLHVAIYLRQAGFFDMLDTDSNFNHINPKTHFEPLNADPKPYTAIACPCLCLCPAEVLPTSGPQQEKLRTSIPD